jgi:hypothetical protein
MISIIQVGRYKWLTGKDGWELDCKSTDMRRWLLLGANTRWKRGDASDSSEALVPITLHSITSQKTTRISNTYYRIQKQYDKVFVSMERVTLLGPPKVTPRTRDLKHTPLIREYVYCLLKIDTRVYATFNHTKQ